MGKLKEQSVFGESPDWKVGKLPTLLCIARSPFLPSIAAATHAVERAGCSFKGGWAGRGCCWQLVATKANLISFAPTNQPSPASAHAPMSPLFGSSPFIKVKQLRPAGDVIVQFTLRFLIQVCAERAGAGGSTRIPVQLSPWGLVALP